MNFVCVVTIWHITKWWVGGRHLTYLKLLHYARDHPNIYIYIRHSSVRSSPDVYGIRISKKISGPIELYTSRMLRQTKWGDYGDYDCGADRWLRKNLLIAV